MQGRRLNDAVKVRVGYGLAGLAIWGAVAGLVTEALLPYRSIVCLAGKELLLALPVGRLCEFVLASSVKGNAVFAILRLGEWTTVVLHTAGVLLRP